jgi:hypothetical protein
MVGPVVTEVELVGAPPEGQPEQLVPEADPEDGDPVNGAGSPGPLERNTPWGSMASTSLAEVDAGTMVKVASSLNWRTMVSFTPKSNTTTRAGPWPRVMGSPIVTSLTRSRPVVEGAWAAARMSACSPVVPIAHGSAPASRTWRVSRRVSTPVMAGTPRRTKKSSNPSSDRQLLPTETRSRVTTPLQ